MLLLGRLTVCTSFLVIFKVDEGPAFDWLTKNKSDHWLFHGVEAENKR